MDANPTRLPYRIMQAVHSMDAFGTCMAGARRRARGQQ